MLIDWFTVAAQLVNFLILVWLLKRFLYKPVLKAIDEREGRIVQQLQDAEAKKAEADKECDNFRQKNMEFDQQREGLMNNAINEVKTERQRLQDETRKEVEALRLQLHETLRNMRTDHLDLWQVHDVRTTEDVESIFGTGGAIEAFVEARQRGMTRFIGVTGHHDPSVLKSCIERFDFDTVLLPVNPAEPEYRNFLEEVVPLARRKEMGIVGMKVYLRGFASRLPGYTGMEPFLRFALSQPVTNVVIGCDDAAQLEENAGFARSFSPMADGEKDELIRSISSYARELMFYKP